MNEQTEKKRLSTADMAGTSRPGMDRDRDNDAKPAMDRNRGNDAPPGTMPAHEKIEKEGLGGDQHDRPSPLFDSGEAAGVRQRWQDIQASFVDEPRRAVESADELVAELMRRLAEVFARERSQLEHQWDRDGDVSTEDLRLAFQRYRSFFDRLLSV